MTSIVPISSSANHDEVDLLALLQSFWRQAILIGVVTVCCAVIAGIYSLKMTPMYQVSTVLRPASLSGLDELNLTKIYHLPPGEALKRLAVSLESYDTRLSYFRSNSALQASMMEPGWTVEQAFERFNSNALRLTAPVIKDGDASKAFIRLDMLYPAGLDGKSVLNGLVQYAIDRERRQITEDLQALVQNRMQAVDAKLENAREAYSTDKQQQIAALLEADALSRAQLTDELRGLRLQLKLRRENRIAELGEAISIARSLGLKRPSTPSSLEEGSVGVGGNVIRTEINNQLIPLYFMGTDALEAEQRVLSKRTSDDFSEPRIARIREKLAVLETNRKVQILKGRENEELFLRDVEQVRAERSRLSLIRTDMSALQLVSVDRLAVEPLRPIKPDFKVFVMLGAVSGFVLGLLIAALRYMLVLRRQAARAV
ncbi:chain-length determining protein [Pseudomonas entomophila]|uniref:Wzz/FepE/Etk N-terminal domain-containing protein n=1 Tax=Pseudomonas entomophila TaxID=312306 RepID=UPI001BD0A60E|nr:Wzz/FepE/Etk N-terminal domain-containing protein [Pseudomonas entomophila]QVM92786.1 chain-length determining protein [Pseudomonas entomophila]